MIDLEQVQRVGKLANDLLSRGMASDTQDAMQKAEQMLSKHQEIPMNIPFGSQTKKISEQKNENEVDYSIIIRRFTMEMDKYKAEIEGMKKMINDLHSEVSMLKDRKSIETKSSTVYIEKEKEKPQTTLRVEEPRKNPRVGGWQPGDVSIEKFFYSGPGGSK